MDPVDGASGSPARQVAAGCELLVRLYQTYPKPEFGLTQTVIDGQTVAVTETVVINRPSCRLLHFERAACRTDPAVLLVAPLSGHHATLLRETVARMLPEFDDYITDWCDARTVPLSDGLFDLDDYIPYLCDFIDHVWRTQVYPRLSELIRQHDMSRAPQRSRGSIMQLSLPASLCAPCESPGTPPPAANVQATTDFCMRRCSTDKANSFERNENHGLIRRVGLPLVYLFVLAPVHRCDAAVLRILSYGAMVNHQPAFR